MKFRAADGIHWQVVADEVVVLDTRTGKYFGLNRTAAYIWRALVAGEGDAKAYATKFALSPEKAAEDFAAVSRDLLKRSFIVEG